MLVEGDHQMVASTGCHHKLDTLSSTGRYALDCHTSRYALDWQSLRFHLLQQLETTRARLIAEKKLSPVSGEEVCKTTALHGQVWSMLTPDNLLLVKELTLDSIRAGGSAIRERTEAMLESVLPPIEDASDGEDDAEEGEAGDGDAAGGGTGHAEQRIRPMRLPRVISLDFIRSFSVHLTRAVMCHITVISMQNNAAALIQRLRSGDLLRLLVGKVARLQLTDSVAGATSISLAWAPDALRRIAKRGYLCVFGEQMGSAPEAGAGPCHNGEKKRSLRLIVKNSFIEVVEESGTAMPRSHSLNTFDRKTAQLDISDTFKVVLSCHSSQAAADNISLFAEGDESDGAFRHTTEAAPSTPSADPLHARLDDDDAYPHASLQPGFLPAGKVCDDRQPATASSASTSSAHLANADERDEDLRTTIMLRGLPPGFTRELLLDMVDRAGFAGKYNFVYLPVDFARNKPLGYALVSLISTPYASRLRVALEGYCKWPMPSDCVCEASWSEPRQCLVQHIERYRNSPVMHSSVTDEYMPAVFEGGVRVAFPAPTKSIRHPRIRHLKS